MLSERLHKLSSKIIVETRQLGEHSTPIYKSCFIDRYGDILTGSSWLRSYACSSCDSKRLWIKQFVSYISSIITFPHNSRESVTMRSPYLPIIRWVSALTASHIVWCLGHGPNGDQRYHGRHGESPISPREMQQRVTSIIQLSVKLLPISATNCSSASSDHITKAANTARRIVE